MLTLAALREKPHTSVSELKTYLCCPKKYYFTYIERTVPAFRPLAVVLGSAWHATIAEHLLRSSHGRHVPVDEVRDHLRDGIIRGVQGDLVPVLFEEEEQDVGAVVDAAMTMLDVFLAKVPVPSVVHGVEVPFSLQLVHPATGEIHPVPLVGAMDAVVEEGGHPVVLELKTGKRRWTADQIDYDLQPTAYMMGARALGHDGAGVKLVLTTKAKKPDVQVEHLVRYRRDEHELVETAFAVARAVKAGVDYPNRGWQCRTCPYAQACGS
jgi:CRISPR/Cas system-associated exonuclease Cas4 (RecB family)